MHLRGYGIVKNCVIGYQSVTDSFMFLLFFFCDSPKFQGKNGTFHLSLECVDDLFDISPNVVVNEAVFSIRVKNHLALDYENITGTNCTITAKEVVSKQAKTTSVPISIRIRDVNDNIPQFTRPSYQVKCNQPIVCLLFHWHSECQILHSCKMLSAELKCFIVVCIRTGTGEGECPSGHCHRHSAGNR